MPCLSSALWCQYPSSVCVSMIIITVAVTQFIKTIFENIGRSNSLSEQLNLKSTSGWLSSHGGVAMVVDCTTDFFLKLTT